MIIYHYAGSSGEYIGSSDADESPLEPGVFLIPANATTEAPPPVAVGFVRRFVGGVWGYSPDETPNTPPTEDPTSPPPIAERIPAIVAQVRIRIVSDIAETAGTDGGIASCSALEPGLLWCDFPQPVDGDYLVWPSDGATHRCYSLAEEQFPEGFAVRSQSYAGEDTFPECLQILVTKS